MKLRSFLAISCVMALSLAQFTQATSYEDLHDIRLQVDNFVSSHVRQNLGNKDFDRQIKIHVGELDHRLKLFQCDKDLDLSLKDNPYGNQITVKTACRGSHRWTIHVPVKVDVFADIVVAAHSLDRGHIITAEDLTYQFANTATLGYGHIEDMKRAIGNEVKRQVKAGQALKLSYMRKAKVIRKGDKVTLEAKTQGLTVIAPGRALANGQVGEQIQVKNTQSDRTVDALVIAPGRVRVSL